MNKVIQKVITIVFVLLCNLSYGQNNMEDVVYLKNGSIIRGIIVEQIPNQSIKIQTKDRNIFVFKYDEIEKITKENLPLDNTNNDSKDASFKKRGFINLTEINFSPGIGNVNTETLTYKNADFSFGFRTVNGYQINEHLSLGLGIGIDKYKYSTLLPITFDARATILKGKVSPVFTANIGYSVGLNEVKGGFVINPQFGIKTYLSENVAYLFNLGYKWQAQEATYYIYPFANNYYRGISNIKRVNLFFQFITISTGITF
jgi:hypothetical protein